MLSKRGARGRYVADSLQEGALLWPAVRTNRYPLGPLYASAI